MSKIPKIIFQTSIERPFVHTLLLVNKYFPGWTYAHFNDDDMENWLAKNKIKDFPNYSEKLKSCIFGAHKADFFRYYFLYVNGGVFLDSDAMVHCNIDEIIQNKTGVFVKSNYFPNSTHIFNGFICVPRRSPIIYAALKHIYNFDMSIIARGGESFQVFCKELINILLKNDLSDIIIYQETAKQEESTTISEIKYQNKVILTHYFGDKNIPKDHE